MAAHEQRLTVYRPVLWRGIKRQEWFGDNTVWFPGADDHHIFGCFFRTEGFYGIDILRIDPTGPGLHWARRGATPTVSFPYDGAHGDGASCMINIERFAPNRAYFNLELEALDGSEERITEIKFDGNRLRCYGGWAVEDSTTVAPTVRERTWLKLDAVLEDGPPPRLLLRVDGQLLYAMPTWHKKGDEAKNCQWVSELLPTRCDVHGDDETAQEACRKTCDTCESELPPPRRSTFAPTVTPSEEEECRTDICAFPETSLHAIDAIRLFTQALTGTNAGAGSPKGGIQGGREPRRV